MKYKDYKAFLSTWNKPLPMTAKSHRRGFFSLQLLLLFLSILMCNVLINSESGGIWPFALSTVVAEDTLDEIATFDERARPPRGNQNNQDEASMLSLGSPSTWKSFSINGKGIVTPRFDPSGENLAVSGLKGNGLFVLSTKNKLTVFADENFKDKAVFSCEEGRNIDRGHKVKVLALDKQKGRFATTDGGCSFKEEDERLGRLVQAGTYASIYHNAYHGTVIQVLPNGDENKIVADRIAWDVVASPDGSRIAYCLGTLSKPELYVHDSTSGLIHVGPGARPMFMPDGNSVIYAVLQVTIGLEGTPIYQSDLAVFDIQQERVTLLTDTKDIAEMEPTLSPDGTSLAFSDWSNGKVYIAIIAKNTTIQNRRTP